MLHLDSVPVGHALRDHVVLDLDEALVGHHQAVQSLVAHLVARVLLLAVVVEDVLAPRQLQLDESGQVLVDVVLVELGSHTHTQRNGHGGAGTTLAHTVAITTAIAVAIVTIAIATTTP